MTKARGRKCERIIADRRRPQRLLLWALALITAASGACGEQETPRRPQAPAAPLEASRAPRLPPVQLSQRPDILLISIDTLRPDHLSLYAYERPTTPRIDAFFADAEIYEQAYSAEASTSPSVASMLSGLYPARHRVRLFYQRVGPEVHLLSDYLASTGYQTAAVVSNIVLTSEAIGFSTRFDHYDDFVDERELNRGLYERRASRTSDAAIQWLDEQRIPGRPHFLWVHYIDPHGPYAAPPDEAPASFSHETPQPIDLARVNPYQLLPGVHDGAEYVDRYDEEIAYADQEVGRLLEHYAALGLAGNAVVILTSDHGENLVEHELYFRHGHHVWNSVMRVPLAIRWPGRAGRRIAKPVSLVDLTPTLLHHIGYPLPAGLDGVPLQERGPTDFLSLEAADWFEKETGYEYRQYRALVSGKRKWFASIDRKLRVGGRSFLDLRSDPDETAPGLWKRGEAGRTLLSWFVDDPDPAGWPRSLLRGQQLDGPKVAPGRSEEELRALRALGYVE